MNKLIKEQLAKCKTAKIPSNLEDSTTHILIPKSGQKGVELRTGGIYNIEVADYIIHPYDTFTLHDNWNKGIVPTDKYMEVEIIQIIGKMIQVKAKGLVDHSQWTGWLPLKSCVIKGTVR